MMQDAYICAYVRTPIGRYGGALSSIRPDDLAAVALQGLLAKVSHLDPAAVDEIVLGCANQAGEDNRNVARMAGLLAGVPDTVPGTTINRLCGSGLDAILYSARAVQTGACEVVIAGGVESMSRAPFVLSKPISAFSRAAEIHDTTIGWRFVNPLMDRLYGTDQMPETAENVAEEFKISRADQDEFALRSQIRAAAAQANGRLAQEIVPVMVRDRKTGDREIVEDEHLRATTLEKLANLPTPFRANGTVTAGNASGVNDGAAALLIASKNAATTHGLTPIARVAGGATAGVAPRLMGIGPVAATKRLCKQLGIHIQKFDVIELNEAFASQALAVLRQLNLEDAAEHVNPNGGAIALGHPLGMSGARIAGSLAMELKEREASLGLATMCIGVGQGIALALERA